MNRSALPLLFFTAIACRRTPAPSATRPTPAAAPEPADLTSPPRAPPEPPRSLRAQICDDGRTELLDFVCRIGRPARDLGFTCRAFPLRSCSATPPAYEWMSCRYEPEHRPATVERPIIRWTSGTTDAIRPLDETPDVTIDGIERIERSTDDAANERRVGELVDRLRALGCRVGRPRGQSNWVYCADLDINVRHDTFLHEWSVEAELPAVHDCDARAHGQTPPPRDP